MVRTGLDRIWTVPNVISFVRLVTVPIFFWLLVSGDFYWALVVLLFASTSDFIDGLIARKFNQITRLGMYLDPISDRLFIAASVLALVIRDMIPVALVAAIVARDVLLLVVFLARKLRIRDAPRVTFLGTIGWVLGVAGGVIYWVAGVGYLRELMRTNPSSTTRATVL
jgi:cardiolipin synthase